MIRKYFIYPEENYWAAAAVQSGKDSKSKQINTIKGEVTDYQ